MAHASYLSHSWAVSKRELFCIAPKPPWLVILANQIDEFQVVVLMTIMLTSTSTIMITMTMTSNIIYMRAIFAKIIAPIIVEIIEQKIPEGIIVPLSAHRLSQRICDLLMNVNS